MCKIILVEDISSPNPGLYLNLQSLNRDTSVYVIQSSTTDNEWILVNQFCSLLTSKWLISVNPSDCFGIKDFPDDEKKAMANQLISFESMEDQVDAAVRAINGISKTVSQVLQEFSSYGPGKKIWMGNDSHVVGIYTLNMDNFVLYDSNIGKTIILKTDAFKDLVTKLHCDAFVVA